MTKETSPKKISLFGNSSAKSQETLEALREKLLAAGFSLLESDEDEPEIVISIGGDGTLLGAYHHYQEQVDRIRFIGVHTGHLGFYTDFLADELDQLVEALKCEDASQAIHYPLLKVQVLFSDGREMINYALNESSLRRYSQTMKANISISDFHFEKFRGDGLVVSTPTGSTAYNKSIGGAVMHPRVEAMQMAEIASLNNRVFRTLGAPMIVAKKDMIRLKPADDVSYRLTVDQKEFNIEAVKEVRYSLDGKTIAFANCAHTPFWARVRNSFIK